MNKFYEGFSKKLLDRANSGGEKSAKSMFTLGQKGRYP